MPALRAGRRLIGDGAATGNKGAPSAGAPAADPTHGTGTDPVVPGNVMKSPSDPTEAPDDLADARRWADDT
jgi:hypothetical protein